jgi:hypothetical protein
MKITNDITLDFHHSVEEKKTSCVITKGNNQYVGVAKCNPKDSFARPIGRKLSLTRILAKELNGNRILNREERTKIWDVLKEKRVNLAF